MDAGVCAESTRHGWRCDQDARVPRRASRLAKGNDGVQHWELDKGATLHDVTHLRCRSARYTPATGDNSCSPAKAQMAAFPVAPGGAMPPLEGCSKQDYKILIVIGMVEDN